MENQKKLTIIQLTDKEAKLFLEFRKHQKEFKQLLENGVFDFLIGQKILHKTGFRISMIETRDFKRFKR